MPIFSPIFWSTNLTPAQVKAYRLMDNRSHEETDWDLEAARKEVARRMAAQWPDEKKIAAADYVIDNSGSLDATEQQVRALYQKLKEEAGG